MRQSLLRLAPNKPVTHLLPPRPTPTSPFTSPDLRTNPNHRPWHPTSPFPAFPSPAEAHKTEEPDTHWLIRQTRSAIGLPRASQRALDALGCRRRFQWVLQRFSTSAAGNILAVKELVEVKTCTKKFGQAWIERTKRLTEEPGIEITGRSYGGGKRV